MLNRQDRSLNFNQFVQERGQQITRFLEDLQQETKKSSHQSLPKSIRRRAMSHNKYRIPHKLRRLLGDDLSKAEALQKIPKCRKHIRKRRHLMMAYQHRHAQKGWLSTHLWAAKRMRMKDYYGFKIAETPNNKSYRSAYRHFRHNCVLLDMSYQQCLKITSGKEYALPPQIKLPIPLTPETCRQSISGLLYKDDLHLELVCPVLIIFSKTSKPAFRCFFHPASKEAVSSLGFPPEYQIEFEQNNMDIYFLAGPEANVMAEKAISQYGLKTEGTSLWKFDKKLKYFADRNDRYLGKPLITPPLDDSLRIKTSYCPQENIDLRAKMLRIFNDLTSPNEQKASPNESAFWDYYELGQNRKYQQTIFTFTTRSRYTHKRKNKLSKIEKKKVIEKETIERLTRKEAKLPKPAKPVEMKQIVRVKSVQKDAHHERHPIMVSTFKNNEFLQGCFIFCSNADNCHFWRILSHLNIKIIGRREYLHLMLESRVKVFPEDYPGTKAHQAEQNMKAGNEITRFLKFPRNKRADYEQISSKYPFRHPFVDAQKNILSVSVSMVSRGRCFPGSYLCKIQRADIEMIEKKLTEEGHIGIVCSEKQGQKQERKKQGIEELLGRLQKLTPMRKVIGFITSGGYLFNISREGGLGYLEISEEELKESGGYVLVRKPTSRHYFVGCVAIK